MEAVQICSSLYFSVVSLHVHKKKKEGRLPKIRVEGRRQVRERVKETRQSSEKKNKNKQKAKIQKTTQKTSFCRPQSGFAQQDYVLKIGYSQTCRRLFSSSSSFSHSSVGLPVDAWCVCVCERAPVIFKNNLDLLLNLLIEVFSLFFIYQSTTNMEKSLNASDFMSVTDLFLFTNRH